MTLNREIKSAPTGTISTVGADFIPRLFRTGILQNNLYRGFGCDITMTTILLLNSNYIK